MMAMLMTLAASPFIQKTVLADSQTPTIGDTIYFGDREWVIIYQDSSEIFILSKTKSGQGFFSYGSGTGTSGYQEHYDSTDRGYIGGMQDRHMQTIESALSSTEQSYLKQITIQSQNYYYGGSSPSNMGSSGARRIYAISADEYAKYAYGKSWETALEGNFYNSAGDTLIWTRNGRMTRRGTAFRPVYYKASGSINCMSVRAPSESVTYGLVSQKTSAGADVSYFSIPTNTSSSFSIAGSTPADVYDLVIQATKTYTNGAITGADNNGGCAERTGSYRPAARIDKSKIPGLLYDSANGRWYIGGSGIPSGSDSNQSGSVNWSANSQNKAMTAVSRTVNINYRLTINKIANPMTFSDQSGSVTYSPTAQNKDFTGATGAQGTLIYTIQAQQTSSGTDVSYFSIPNQSNASFAIAAGTPAGTYKITLRASVAGNSGYNSANIDKTYTLTVNKATPTVTAPTDKGSIYNTALQDLINVGSTTGGTIKYSLDNVNYSTEIPQATDVGNYTVYYRVDGDSNYNSVAVKSIVAHIYKADNPIKVVTPQDRKVYYSLSDQSVEFDPATDAQGAVTYQLLSVKDSSGSAVSGISLVSSSSTEIKIAAETPVDNYTLVIRATAAGNSNYNAGSKDITLRLEVKHSSVPEITVTFYSVNDAEKTIRTDKGKYQTTPRANAETLDVPHVIGISAIDTPITSGGVVTGITQLYCQISTDGGNTYGGKHMIYDGEATTAKLQGEVTSPTITGTYYIKVVGINAIENEGQLVEVYKVTKGPALYIKDRIYYVGSDVSAADLLSAVSANDEKDGNISDRVVIDRIVYEDGTVDEHVTSLDTSKVQTFAITYSVTNSEGKTTTKAANRKIVDRTSVDDESELDIYDRYIDLKMIETIDERSIWYTDPDYKNALDEAVQQSGLPRTVVVD